MRSFSLRSIFVTTTLIAILTAIFVQAPQILLFGLVVSSLCGFGFLPILVIRAVALAVDLDRDGDAFNRTVHVILICLVLVMLAVGWLGVPWRW